MLEVSAVFIDSTIEAEFQYPWLLSQPVQVKRHPHRRIHPQPFQLRGLLARCEFLPRR